jgi:hypothetical protein
MSYLKILSTAFIIGLSVSSANGQNEGNPSLFSPQRGETNTGVFYYDSSEVAKIAELILENETLKENEELYMEKDSLNKVNRILFENKISSLNEIIKLKDEQIEKLEKTPLQIIDKSWKWWHYMLAAIRAVTFGFTAGIMYENLNH